jgi:hypothetical protein
MLCLKLNKTSLAGLRLFFPGIATSRQFHHAFFQGDILLTAGLGFGFPLTNGLQ